MHVSVGEESEEMESRIIRLNAAYKLPPCRGSEDLTGFDGLRNKLCSLRKHLSRSERVMSYLGISHIIIRRKTNGCAVSLEFQSRILTHKHIKSGSFCVFYGIGNIILSNTYTIHNNTENRSLLCLLVIVFEVD
jgi:hypothetical protein